MALNTRSAAANIANAKMAQLNINRENTEHLIPATKATLAQRPHTAAGSRNALGDIGNKVSAISISDGSKKAPIKKEIVQLTTRQQKMLTRSKATSSLKSHIVAENSGSNVADKPPPPREAFHFLQPEVPPVPKATEPPAAPVVPTEPPPTTVHPSPMDISDTGPDAFSKALLLNVQDIDLNDKENPQLVSEYVNNIYEYMRGLEKKYPIRPHYLDGQEVTGKMRAILIDWLCQVHHRFHLLQETLYLTVSIIDRFLQVNTVSRNKLQLVGVTAMLLASKYEEMYAPEVADFVYMTDNAYNKKEILEMEGKLLRTLNFSFGRPLCLHFLRRNSKAGQVDANKHTLAKYLMELTITEYDMVQYNPSQTAAAALCLSMKLLDNTRWTETLSHYSSYTEGELAPTMNKLAYLVIKAENSKLTAVRTKYSSSKFMKISLLSELRSTMIKDMAAEAAALL